MPRGFLLNYNDDAFFGGSDHNIAQLAYRLGEVAAVDNKIVPRRMVDSTYVSWRSDFIIKDNDDRREFTSYETVGTIGGPDAGYIQPPYSILPVTDPGWFTGCLSTTTGQETNEFIIQNIPYQYAIPMLTGWDLENICRDKEVKSIGVFIEKWNYLFDINSPIGGNLNYKLTTIVEDGSGEVSEIATHHVTVLGIIDISKHLK